MSSLKKEIKTAGLPVYQSISKDLKEKAIMVAFSAKNQSDCESKFLAHLLTNISGVMNDQRVRNIDTKSELNSTDSVEIAGLRAELNALKAKSFELSEIASLRAELDAFKKTNGTHIMIVCFFEYFFC